MILSDKTLSELLNAEELVIDPLESSQVQPASVDLRLGNNFLKIDENLMEVMTLRDETQYVNLQREEITIPPHSFLLATTRETIELPEYITACV